MRSLLLFVALCLAWTTPATAQAGGGKKPNILFILIDDLRPELGCYGRKHMKTPHLDALAQRGTLFERAYCHVPICGPSRACLLAGRYPVGPKHHAYFARADEMFPGVPTLPEMLKKAGYITLSIGKVFHVPADNARAWTTPPVRLGSPLDQKDVNLKKFRSAKGRGTVFERPDVADDAYPDGRNADRAIAEIRRLAKEKKPFFLACGFHLPHLPFYAPKKYWDRYDGSRLPLPEVADRPKKAPPALKGSGEFRAYHFMGLKEKSEKFTREMRHGYIAGITYVDAMVGRVLQALRETGLEEETIVIVWGDHGWHLGDYGFWGKHNLLDVALRVPLILHVPGMPGSRHPGIVQTVDILPTLRELAGIEAAGETAEHGRSLVPVLRDPKHRLEPRPAYAEFQQGRSIHSGRWHYVEYGPKGKNGRMLFDSEDDPRETLNLADSPAQRETLAAMRKLLGAYPPGK